MKRSHPVDQLSFRTRLKDRTTLAAKRNHVAIVMRNGFDLGLIVDELHARYIVVKAIQVNHIIFDNYLRRVGCRDLIGKHTVSVKGINVIPSTTNYYDPVTDTHSSYLLDEEGHVIGTVFSTEGE